MLAISKNDYQTEEKLITNISYTMWYMDRSSLSVDYCPMGFTQHWFQNHRGRQSTFWRCDQNLVPVVSGSFSMANRDYILPPSASEHLPDMTRALLWLCSEIWMLCPMDFIIHGLGILGDSGNKALTDAKASLYTKFFFQKGFFFYCQMYYGF